MKRRRFFQSALALPAGTALLAQLPAPAAPLPPPQRPEGAPSGMEYPKIDASSGDQAAAPILHFFAPSQFAALKRLSDLLMPGGGPAPGAIEAQVPEFLDFLIGKSPVSRQKIYTTGLDALNKLALSKQKKSFAELDDTSAAELIAPAIKPWNYVPPTDPLEHLMLEARHDIRLATINSREHATAGASSDGGGRRRGGVGMYWYSLEGI